MGSEDRPDLDALTEERTELQKKLESLNVEIDNLRTRHEEISAEVRGLKITVGASESKRDRMEARLKEIEEEVARAAKGE